MTALRLVAAALALALFAGLFGCNAAPNGRSVGRALWVKRWDFRTEEQVRTAIDRAADCGFDSVFFQVRGNGTVFYRSKLEPWAEEFGHRDPGFDPLEVACDQAAKRGIALHAWINAIPGWRGSNPPPPDIGHLYHEHREWFLRDAEQEWQPLQPEYIALNPCLPEVRAHIVAVAEEIVTGYPVAGLHLDYIRFLMDYSAEGKDYPHDPETLRLFDETHEATPSEKPKKWIEWRTDQVSILVRDIRVKLREVRPDALLTAAVFRTPKRAMEQLQDWPTWCNAGWVDAVVPMIYETDDQKFASDLRDCVRSVKIPVIAGIGIYKQTDVRQVLRQENLAAVVGATSAAWFDYAALFDPETPPARPEVLPELREARREALFGTAGAGSPDH